MADTVSIKEASITEGREYRENINELHDHPKNSDVYVDTEISDIVDSLEEHGYVEYERVVITNVEWDEFDWPTPRVISGHRRKQAATEVGLEDVPVVEVEPSSPQEELRLLLLENRYRNKSRAEVVNEGELWEEIESLEAKERQSHGKTAPGKTLPQDFGEASKGETVEKVGEKVGVSGETYRQGRKVKRIAEGQEDAPWIVKWRAKKEWEKLEEDEQSFSGAYNSVREAEKRYERRKREGERRWQQEQIERPTLDGPTPVIHNSDAGDLPLDDASVNLIITSPPYNLGHERWPMGGEGRQERDEGIGYDDSKPEDEYQSWQIDVFNELYRVAAEGASFFYNHKVRQNDGEIIHPMDWLRSGGNPWTVRQEIIWDRTSTHNHSPQIFWPHDERIYWLTKGDPELPEDGVGMESIWKFHGPRSNTDHPAPFPDELPRRCIEAVACDGDVILDPFGGSMTTCEVAAKLGYESIGVDINEEYVEAAKRRLGLS